MALTTFSIGRDTQLVVMGPTGRVDLSHVTGFESHQITHSVRVNRIDGSQLGAELPRGWEGNFEIERGTSVLDDFMSALEQRFFDGGEFFDAEGWCEGFMLAVSVFIDAWRPVLEQHMELVAPMVLLGTDRGWKMLEESGNNKEATRQAYESIPAAVLALREYFKPQREAMARSNAGAPVPTTVFPRKIARSTRRRIRSSITDT